MIKGLEIEGVSCLDLSKEYGTPLFVISQSEVRSNYKEFLESFQSHYPGEIVVCVGLKSNYGLAIRKIIAEEGGGGDVFGLGELYIALMAGTDPDKIVMNGPNKSRDMLEAALEAGVIINIDCLSELDEVLDIATKRDEKADVCLRIRLPLDNLSGRMYVDPRYGPPGVDVAKWEREFKFGMEPAQIYEAVKKYKDSSIVNLKGLMYHGGIPRRAGFYQEEVQELMDYVKKIYDEFNWQPQILNLGGGFIPRRRGLEKPPSIDECAGKISEVIKSKAKSYKLSLPKLYLEPGRYCIESAVTYLVEVGRIKTDTQLTNKKWVYVDGNINEMADPIDPFLNYHEVLLANNPNAPAIEVVDICGQLCNAADILAGERKIPGVKEGDILAFLDMGAYNESFANQSNAMPRSPSVLVSNGRWDLVRKRETVQDIINREIVPYWLL